MGHHEITHRNNDNVMGASMWFEFFEELFQCQDSWYMGGKRDNKEKYLN